MNASFENNSCTPDMAAAGFFSPDWESHRDSGIAPRFVSSFDGSEAGREGFLWGARALGLDKPGKPLHPQQLVVCDALNARTPDGLPLHPMMAVLLPRRSAKTTTIVANALGRCWTTPGWVVGFTLATTGQKARDRFRTDIAGPLSRAYPDPATRPFTIRLAAGSEGVFFDNGSRFHVLTPSADAFRSEAFDEVIVDEAGEATVERSDDILTGALATMDTRPNAQFIVAGTAPEFRNGNLLYDTLEDGRGNRRRTGIVEYSAPGTVTADDLADWDLTAPLVLAAHPGIGTLTTLDTIRDRWDRLKPEQFSREYLSIPGLTGVGHGILDWEKWQKAGTTGDLPTPPASFALVAAAHPVQHTAALVAVWRDDDGIAHLLVLDHRHGTDWLPGEAVRLAQKYGVPIVHDNRGVILVEAEQMQRAVPRPRMAPQTTKDVTTAAGLLVREFEAGRIVHYRQPALDEAARLARQRAIGGTWAFGRAHADDDIIVLEAASLGLRYFDNRPVRPEFELLAA